MTPLEHKYMRILELIGTHGFMLCCSNEPEYGDAQVVIRFSGKAGRPEKEHPLYKAQELHRLLLGVDVTLAQLNEYIGDRAALLHEKHGPF